MTITERITLIRAGYKADEIRAMEANDALTAEQHDIEQHDNAVTEEKNPVYDALASMKTSIDSLTRAMQSNNTRNIEQPERKPTQSLDDALASVINPYLSK